MERYSNYEQNVILEEVKKFPTNYQQAFEAASKRIPCRSKESISAYWYSVLKYDSRATALGSELGMVINVKNTPRKKDNRSFAHTIAECALVDCTKEEMIDLVKKMLKHIKNN